MTTSKRTTTSIPMAIKKFTDREEPRKSFWNNYNAKKEQMVTGDTDAKVLVYYGIGGIGKSKLLTEIEKEIDKANEEIDKKTERIKYCCYNFDSGNDIVKALKLFRDDLCKKYKFSFSLFDVAYYAYCQKNGLDVKAPEVLTFTFLPCYKIIKLQHLKLIHYPIQ